MKVTLKIKRVCSEAVQSSQLCQRSRAWHTRAGVCWTGCWWEPGLHPLGPQLVVCLLARSCKCQPRDFFYLKAGAGPHKPAKPAGLVDLKACPLTRGRKSPPPPCRRGYKPFSHLSPPKKTAFDNFSHSNQCSFPAGTVPHLFYT